VTDLGGEDTLSGIAVGLLSSVLSVRGKPRRSAAGAQAMALRATEARVKARIMRESVVSPLDAPPANGV
jgi:hypothetical protein